MLKRSIVFESPVSLTLKNAQLIVTYKDVVDDEPRTIPIEDIGIVLINNQRISMSIPLINALADASVAVVFCNERNMPNSMLQQMDGNCLQGEILRNQIEVGEVLKKQLWKQIIEAKIHNQSLLLDKYGKNGDILRPLYSNVKSGDADNREGIAARMYWAELFGPDFSRDRTEIGINALLNYGYTILRAAVSRSIVSSGLFPAFGIYHKHRSNAFPLADDLMEPYRPYVDEVVYRLYQKGHYELNQQSKAELINMLYNDTRFDNVTRPLTVGLSITTASLVKCYAKEEKKLNLPYFE